MSRANIYVGLFNMLSDMTIANGYSRDYTPVKSVDNDSATMKQTPFISLHLGLESNLDEGVGINEYRSLLPVIITARVKVEHSFRNEIEYEEDIQRSRVIDDIKKRFSTAYKELADCVRLEPYAEEDARNDSNKHDMYIKYIMNLTYKTKR